MLHTLAYACFIHAQHTCQRQRKSSMLGQTCLHTIPTIAFRGLISCRSQRRPKLNGIPLRTGPVKTRQALAVIGVSALTSARCLVGVLASKQAPTEPSWGRHSLRVETLQRRCAGGSSQGMYQRVFLNSNLREFILLFALSRTNALKYQLAFVANILSFTLYM
jgi:hypothetical protein